MAGHVSCARANGGVPTVPGGGRPALLRRRAQGSGSVTGLASNYIL